MCAYFERINNKHSNQGCICSSCIWVTFRDTCIYCIFHIFYVAFSASAYSPNFWILFSFLCLDDDRWRGRWLDEDFVAPPNCKASARFASFAIVATKWAKKGGCVCVAVGGWAIVGFALSRVCSIMWAPCVARVYICMCVPVHWYWPKGVARFQLASRQFSAFSHD